MSLRPAARPVALSCGEPSGIGPEIAARARGVLGADLPFFWIGDPRHLPAGSAWQAIARPADAAGVAPDILPVLTHDFPAPAIPGRPDPSNAAAVVAVIARAVALVRAGEASAITTAPINKKALKDGAGFAFPGHTEYLAALAGVERVVMMLACPDLRVVPVTIHIPLSEVPAALTPGLLEETLRITRAGLVESFGIAAPCIAAGINPHAAKAARWGPRNSGSSPSSSTASGPGLTIAAPARRHDVPPGRARRL